MLFLIKTLSKETGETNWFLGTAPSYPEVKKLCEDDYTKILEVYTDPKDIARVIADQHDSLALLSTI